MSRQPPMTTVTRFPRAAFLLRALPTPAPTPRTARPGDGHTISDTLDPVKRRQARQAVEAGGRLGSGLLFRAIALSGGAHTVCPRSAVSPPLYGVTDMKGHS
jgi:hypothetical protein